MRKLIITKRDVETDRIASYDAEWRRFERAAADRPVRTNAWRFKSADTPGAFVEFLEFPADADPRPDPALNAALRALDAIAPANSEEWDDAPVPTTQDSNA